MQRGLLVTESRVLTVLENREKEWVGAERERQERVALAKTNKLQKERDAAKWQRRMLQADSKTHTHQIWLSHRSERHQRLASNRAAFCMGVRLRAGFAEAATECSR
ncbi:hypothetical protein BWQ96_03996 [Gracilariopsis chorda]|uniref:Uncharacterized protein n=1 Tax=Gracilariopsis chorda TaxID=448386 RepID=A0A2V3IVR7_9FLOR|nr:hypothetical protein BWQ96_03996 [Gracilariopsis chorda]|eukprot:PXF46211.1 hypothetical protein BWQ96_03996 [Gracilariopsis chorda]